MNERVIIANILTTENNVNKLVVAAAAAMAAVDAQHLIYE